jgi:hypothetical protein
MTWKCSYVTFFRFIKLKYGITFFDVYCELASNIFLEKNVKKCLTLKIILLNLILLDLKFELR